MRPSLIGALLGALVLVGLTSVSPSLAAPQASQVAKPAACASAAGASALADSARANQAAVDQQLVQAQTKAAALKKKLKKAKLAQPGSPKAKALAKKYRAAKKAVGELTASAADAATAVQSAELASEAANLACPAPLGPGTNPPSPTGQVTLDLVTPDGVPAAVTLVPDAAGTARAAAAKPAPGTTIRADLTLPTGSWTISPEPVVHDGQLYEAPQQRVVVTQGGVAGATVAYVAVPAVTDLQVAGFTADSITLEWAAPSPSRPVVVRSLVGTDAPTTPTEGTSVPVTGDQAVATGLLGGATYSFAVFTQVDGAWRGPLVTTATTAAVGTGASATFVAAPETRVVDPGQVVPAVTVGGGAVRALLPGAVPVPGQGVVLPVSASLPGGFVGRVESVGPDGSAVLRQAGMSAAFDYLDLQVPDIGTAADRARPAARPPALAASCEGSPSLGLEPVRPTLDGSFDASLATRDFLGIPTSLGADISVEVSVSVTLAVRAAIQVAATCALELPSLVRQFQVGPVPMLLMLSPIAEIELSAGATVSNLGLTAKGGFRGSAHIPLIGLSGGPELDGSVFGNAEPLTPEGTVSAEARLKLGGEVVLGPGAGTSDAGLVAGIVGTLLPVDATATVDLADPGCLELNAGLSAGIGLTARVWVDALDFEWDKTLPLVEGTKPYGGPWYLPDGCQFGGYTGFLELVGTAGFTHTSDYDGSKSGSSGSISALAQFGPRGGPGNENGVVILRRTGSWSSYGGDCNTSFRSTITPGVWTPYDYPIQDDGGVRGYFGPMMHFPETAPATGSYDICGPGGANPFDGPSPYWNVLPPSAHDFLKKSHSLSMWYRWRNPDSGYTIPSVVDEDHSVAMADMCNDVYSSPYNCDAQSGTTGTWTGQHRVRARLTSERDRDFDGIPDRLDPNPTVVDPL